MQPLARKALESLWRRADRANLKGVSRTVSLRLSASSFPEYVRIQTREEKDTFHAHMREASRAGAIGIEWDRRAGEDGQIVGITLRSADALGALLGHSTTTSKIAAARSALAEWAAHPNVAALVQAWMAGRSPRGVGVECVQDVVDTMKLVKECADNQYQDVSERRVSARLFGDSKRIEQLSTVIDLMTAQTFDEAEPRTQIAVLSDLGLLKHPQAMLVSGRLELSVGRDNPCAAPLSVTFPYVGVAPLHVYAALGSPTYVLSVENLTIFNELAKEAAGPLTGVLLYTGGYPSPAMLKAYKVILESFDVPIWHWGDTDLGGFRIANLLATAAKQVDRSLQLWQMAVYGHSITQRELSSREVASICSICDRWGWEQQSRAVRTQRTRIEQELQNLLLPM